MAQRLELACKAPEHAFWAADVSLLAPGVINWRHVLGHRPVTDAYLLALAVRNNGKLVTFDQRLTNQLVAGPTQHYLVLIT